MRPWRERSAAERALLNPALIAVILREGAYGYGQHGGIALPFALAFLLVPVVLHPESRSALPRTVRTAVTAWLGSNPAIRSTVRERVPGLAPLVRDGTRLGLASGVLELDAGGLRPRQLRRSAEARQANELQALLVAARFVGRWTARVESPATVCALWGVRP